MTKHINIENDELGTKIISLQENDHVNKDLSNINYDNNNNDENDDHNTFNTETNLISKSNSKSKLESNENQNDKHHFDKQINNDLGKQNNAKNKKTSKFANIKPDDIVIIGNKSSLYSTAYTLHKVELFTEGAIRFFRKSTFSRINNCLFNLCMILPIHMNDDEYKKIYQKLTFLFDQTEQQINDGYSRLLEIIKKEITTMPELKYSAPLSIELKLRTPLAERYLSLIKLLDQMLITIDQALTIGIIQNPKDAVKLKYRWEQNIYQFSGEIRNLDIQTDRNTKNRLSKAKQNDHKN